MTESQRGERMRERKRAVMPCEKESERGGRKSLKERGGRREREEEAI